MYWNHVRAKGDDCLSPRPNDQIISRYIILDFPDFIGMRFLRCPACFPKAPNRGKIIIKKQTQKEELSRYKQNSVCV